MDLNIKCFSVIFFTILMAPAYAELEECSRVGYTTCSINQPCQVMAYARSGKCIQLTNIVANQHYFCEKSGFSSIDKFDDELANSSQIKIKQNDFSSFEVTTTQLTPLNSAVILAVYNPYDMPDKFMLTCKALSFARHFKN